MYRSLIAAFACCLLFAACKTTSAISSATPVSSVSRDITLVKYGAGSAEDDSSADSRAPNKAAAPMGLKRLKGEEALARATVYEGDLDAALAIPDYPAALAAFDSAAALLSAVPSASDRLSALRAKMDKALDAISFDAVIVPSETIVGNAFKRDFVARASVSSPTGKKPFAGLACIVFYPSVNEAGDRVILSEKRVTGADGTISFAAPVPTKTGKNVVVVAAALGSTDPAMRDSIRARQERGQLASSMSHGVVSGAKTYSTVISLLDYDQNGKPILSTNVSSTMLLQPFVPRGFHRIGMADFPNQLATGDEAVLLKAARSQFSGGVQRFIYGTVRVTSLTKADDGTWTCALAADVSVWDFPSDSKVYHTTPAQVGAGKTEAIALDAARRKLLADTLANDLYYNM